MTVATTAMTTATEMKISNWKILVQHIILYILLAKVFIALYLYFSRSCCRQADLFFKCNDDDDGDRDDDDVEGNITENVFGPW